MSSLQAVYMAGVVVSLLCQIKNQTWCRMASMEQLVLPAPVGAQMRIFSAVPIAVSQTLLCMRFKEAMPLQ